MEEEVESTSSRGGGRAIAMPGNIEKAPGAGVIIVNLVLQFYRLRTS